MHPCPRIAEDGRPPLDSHWRPDGTCSYCGSISPAVLFKAIADGCELGPTDKSYKVYVDLVEEHPSELIVSGASNSADSPGDGWQPADVGLLKKHGFSSDYTWMLLTPRGPVKHAKFYFQHLSRDEQLKFIDLLNQRKVNLGYPGHFYRLPFFCQKMG